MVTLCFFVCVVYIQSPLIGSSGKMYDLLEANRVLPLPTLAELSAGYHSGPVSGNREGSHITMLSGPGLMFGIINIIGNFGTVFLDQSYWQSAIAAKPSASHKGYMLGGLVWFCIPFSLATSLGLAATALGVKLTPAEAGAGLVPPAIAVVLVGRSGAVAILIMLFMAIVSTGSAEMMAVGSISAYDIYFTYINPKATGKRIIFITRVVTVVFGALMGVLAVILDAFGIGLGWVYLFMGIVIGVWSSCARRARRVSRACLSPRTLPDAVGPRYPPARNTLTRKPAPGPLAPRVFRRRRRRARRLLPHLVQDEPYCRDCVAHLLHGRRHHRVVRHGQHALRRGHGRHARHQRGDARRQLRRPLRLAHHAHRLVAHLPRELRLQVDARDPADRRDPRRH
jgi:Na+/proline symporter